MDIQKPFKVARSYSGKNFYFENFKKFQVLREFNFKYSFFWNKILDKLFFIFYAIPKIFEKFQLLANPFWLKMLYILAFLQRGFLVRVFSSSFLISLYNLVSNCLVEQRICMRLNVSKWSAKYIWKKYLNIVL